MNISKFFLPVALLLALLISTFIPQPSNLLAEESTTAASPVPTECWENIVPAAALPKQPGPVFCDLTTQARDTARILDERWIDTFDHGLSFADFTHTSYLVFEAANRVYDSVHWRHADHWMVDIAPSAPDKWDRLTGGAMLRPDRQFWQVGGKIIVEADYAAGHQDYSDLKGWGEIVITTAAEPGDYRKDGIYAYDMFPGSYTLGCRLQADRHVICSLMDNTERGSTTGGRIWEMSFFQQEGRKTEGGFPTEESAPYWRVCAADNQPDADCRDRFRLELERDSLTMYVNGYKYFSQRGIRPLPDELFNGSFYVYFASLVGQPNDQVVRFHWDRLAVNPALPPSAADNFVPPASDEAGATDEIESSSTQPDPGQVEPPAKGPH